MLNLILGRAASGKTTLLRNIAAEKLRLGDEVIFLVPEQFSFESEKALIELLGASSAAQMRVLSFSSFAKNVVREFLPEAKPYVNDAAKAVIMSLALEAVSDKLCIYARCLKNINGAKELLSMTDELIQCGIDREMLVSAAEKSDNQVLLNKTLELSLISQMYETLLSERFSDDRYLINSAADIAAKKELFKNKTVFFDEFTGFTKQENDLISVILKQAKDVYFTFCTDSVHDSSLGTSAFSYVAENACKLISLAKELGVKVAEPVITANDFHFRSAALKHIEENLYEPDFVQYEFSAPEITVAAAETMYDECDYVAMSAKKLVREKGIRYRDIVVCGRDSQYSRYLPYAFKKYGIPVFEDRRRNLGNELIVVFSVSALALAAEGFNTEMMLRYLKTYLTGIDDDDICAVENYVYIWNIEGNEWLSEWKNHPDGFGNQLDDNSEQQLLRLNAIRKKAAEPILKLRERLAENGGREASKALYTFLTDINAASQLLKFALELDEASAYECERSWDEFMNTLSLLDDTLHGRSITPRRYLELFKIMMSGSDIGSLPSGLDMITVGDADRIRVSDKKVLFIVGANEGVFPASLSSSFVLTDNERRILKNYGLELNDDGMDALRKERLRVYSALTIPRDMLFVSYSLGTPKGEMLSPSEIVSGITAMVPFCSRVDVSLIDIIESCESSRSAFENAALHLNDNTAVSDSLKCYVNETEFAHLLNAAEKNAKKLPSKIENTENAVKLFKKEMYISSSKVEKYHECPFKYFCTYGINVKKREQASFDARINGNLVHRVLEKLIGENGSKKLMEMSKAAIKAAVDAETQLYIEECMGGFEALNPRLKYSLERCKDNICEIIDRLISELAISRFETRDVELKIADDGDVPPYRVDLADGGKAVISGIADRIDTMPSADGEKTYLRVVDYKTGGKDFKLSDILSGVNLQMLIYLACIKQNGKERYGNVIPAGVLYVPAKKSRNSLGRNAEKSEIEHERLLQGKMRGLVLADEEVIRGMEESAEGLIIEAKIDKNGNIKGKTFDEGGFVLIEKTINSVVAHMVSSLHGGRIEALPLRFSSQKTACDYCDYFAVCNHESDDEFKEIFDGDAWDAMKEVTLNE